MTISSLVSKNQYIADGSITTFTYGFRIITQNDIVVVLTDVATGIDTVQVLNTNYTVTGANNAAGGTIIFNVAPGNGLRVTIARDAQALQLEHYVENDPFPAASHEVALDRLTTVVQTALEEVSRGLQVSIGTDGSVFSNQLPPITANDVGAFIVVKDDLSGFTYTTEAVGDVVGPDSSTDNAIARFDGLTGKVIESSLASIDDSGNLSAPNISTGVMTAASVVATGTVSATTVTAPTITASGTVTGSIVTGTTRITSPEIDGDEVNGTIVNTGNLRITELAGTPGAVTFYDGAGTNYVSFTAPISVSHSATYRLPAMDGVPGQVLTTDGLGNLAWMTGVPQKMFVGTLASLSDVSFFNLTSNQIFNSPNGTLWSNMSYNAFSNIEPYNINISKTNVAETRSANIDMDENEVIRAQLKQFTETANTQSASSTTTIDLTLANVFPVDQAVDTTLVFANPSFPGTHCSFTLLRRKDATGTARHITWPSSVKWPQGTVPTLTQTASAVDSFFFRTVDGGTSWLGYLASSNFS